MKDENYTFTFRTPLPLSKAEAFKWHQRPGMFERLSPPFINSEMVSKNPQLKLGGTVHLKLNLFHKVGVHCIFEITDFQDGHSFTDQQIKGPFAFWKHHHEFQEVDNEHCVVVDTVTFRLHFESFLGALLHHKIAKRLKHIFTYRQRILQNDLLFYKKYAHEKQHILMTGSTGLIGRSLANFLTVMGHRVTPITRHLQADKHGVFWDIENQKIDLEQLEGFDAVIHLAGENIAGLWSEHKREKIYKSRIHSTRLLVKAFNQLKNPPKVFLCASGCNYYKQGTSCTEEDAQGEGFLAQVAQDVELESLQFKKGRVVNMRTGVVLSPRGGMLKKILGSFELGLGTKIGKGSQHLSWISIDDLLYQYTHVLMTKELQGAVNLTSPEAICNEEFSKKLAQVLKRPFFLSLPEGLVHTFLGDMGKETLLSDLIVQPVKLTESNGTFYYPKLDQALTHLLGLD